MRIIRISNHDLNAQLQRANFAIDRYCKQHTYHNFNQVLSVLAKTGQIPQNYHQLLNLSRARSGYRLHSKTLQTWKIVLVGGEYHLSDFCTKKTPLKRRSKSLNSRGLGAWLVYTSLHTKSPYFDSPNPPILDIDSSTEIGARSQFQNYLLNRNLDTENLDADRQPLYELHNFMRSSAPVGHRVAGCLQHRVRAKDKKGSRGVFVLVDDDGKLGIGNIARCGNPFCAFCSPHDKKLGYEKSRLVQKIHTTNGGDCLQLTLTAPHSIRTKLDIFYPKLQSAYAIFNRKTAKFLKNAGLMGKSKSNEYAYSVKNGHAPHIHVAYAVAAIGDNHLQELRQFMSKIWLSALTEVGLIKHKRQHAIAVKSALNLIKNPNAFSYIAKIAPPLPKIENIRAKIKKNRSLTIFELATLAKNAEFNKKRFARIYGELLAVWHGVTSLKFSPLFLESMGLMVDVEDESNSANSSLKQCSATDDIATARKRRKKRYIYELPRKQRKTLLEIDWRVWCALVAANEHLILLAILQYEYDRSKNFVEYGTKITKKSLHFGCA